MAADSKPQGWGDGKLPKATVVKHPQGWKGADSQKQADARRSGKG